MNSFIRLHEESNKIGSEFLMTELETALTFLAVAETTTSAETRERNRNNAFVAYKTVLRLQPKVVIEPRRKNDFQQRVTDLKRRLQVLGFEIT